MLSDMKKCLTLFIICLIFAEATISNKNSSWQTKVFMEKTNWMRWSARLGIENHDQHNNLNSNNIFRFIRITCSQLFEKSPGLNILTSSSTASFILSIIRALDENINQKFNSLEFQMVSVKESSRKVANHRALQGLRELLSLWHRYNVLIFYDSSINMAPKTIKYLLKIKSINSTVHYIDKINKYKCNFVQTIGVKKHVVVMFGEENTKHFIKCANDLQLFSNRFASWFFVSSNHSMAFWNRIYHPQTQINLLLTQDSFQNFFSAANDSLQFNYNPRRQNKSMHRHLPLECLSSTPSSKNISMQIINRVSGLMARTSIMGLYDLFFSHSTNRTEVLQIGRWKPKKGLKFFTSLKDFDAGKMLRGREIDIITFEEQPYLFINNGTDGPQFSGYLYHLLIILTEHLRMKPLIKIAEVAATGIEMSPGNYTGVVGTLFRRESDLAMASLGMTVSRRPAIRFSAPVITEMYLTIFIHTPPPGISYTHYFNVFTRQLWITVAVVLILTIITIMLIARFRPIAISPNNISTSPIKKSMTNVQMKAYWVISGMFFEEVFNFTHGKAAKVVLGVFLIATLIVNTCFSSTLTSFLISQTTKLPFNDMDSLIYDHPDYKIILVSGTNHYDHFRNSKQGMYAKVWERVFIERKLKDVVADVTEGLDKLSLNKHVFFGDGPSGKYLARHNSNVTFLTVNYFNELSHYPIRMDFPYYKILSTTLQKLNENGILNLLSRRYFPFLKKSELNTQETNTLDLQQVTTPFIILLAGVTISVCALIIELLANAICVKHETKASSKDKY